MIVALEDALNDDIDHHGDGVFVTLSRLPAGWACEVRSDEAALFSVPIDGNDVMAARASAAVALGRIGLRADSWHAIYAGTWAASLERTGAPI